MGGDKQRNYYLLHTLDNKLKKGNMHSHYDHVIFHNIYVVLTKTASNKNIKHKLIYNATVSIFQF